MSTDGLRMVHYGDRTDLVSQPEFLNEVELLNGNVETAYISWNYCVALMCSSMSLSHNAVATQFSAKHAKYVLDHSQCTVRRRNWIRRCSYPCRSFVRAFIQRHDPDT